MENYKRELIQQLQAVDKLIKRSDDNLKRLRAVPDECIRNASKGDQHRYYRKDAEVGGSYI